MLFLLKSLVILEYLSTSTCVWVLEYSGSQFCNLDCAKNADWEGWSQAGLQGQMDSLAAKHTCKKYPENIQKTTQFRVRWHILRFAFTFKSSVYIWIHCVGLAKNAELKGWDKSMARIDSGDFFFKWCKFRFLDRRSWRTALQPSDASFTCLRGNFQDQSTDQDVKTWFGKECRIKT